MRPPPASRDQVHGIKRLALPLAVAALAAPAAQAQTHPLNHSPKSDSETPPTVFTSSDSSSALTGTDWVDRGFGVGAVFGAVVVGAGLGLSARKARREATA